LSGICTLRDDARMPHPNVDASLVPQLIAAFGRYPKDVVTLARVERAARSVACRNPFLGAILLGACAAAKGDTASARRHHEVALRIQPDNLSAWTNYLVSLSILGDVETVRAKAFEMRTRFPGNPVAIQCAIDTLEEIGLLQSAAHVRNRGNRLASDDAVAWENAVDNVLRAHGLEEGQLAEVVLAARDFLAGQGVVRAAFTCEFFDDDVGGPGYLAYGFNPRTDPDTAHELEGRLFEFLVQHPYLAETCGAIMFFIGVPDREGGLHASGTG
jgi:hypothetical protein